MTGAVQEVRHVFLGMQAVIASEPMRQLLALAERVARSGASVLITGESGSGKEVIARAVHHYSPRSHKPWVDLNCAALPENLLESELFGYEKGAFSGANTRKAGLFELAHQGTIFLDEIGEIDPRVQVKLLRVLDGAPYFRLGGLKKVGVDVRIVAATNADLDQAVARGQFRNDLFHRLCQFTLEVPPLRARVADIVPLAQQFLSQQYPEMSFSPAALDALVNYRWPGNIRELRNAVMRAAIVTQTAEIQPQDLPLKPYSTRTLTLVDGRRGEESSERRWGIDSDHSQGPLDAAFGPGTPVSESFHPARPNLGNPNRENPNSENPNSENPNLEHPNLEHMERRMIFEALHATGGHHQKAAARLGISRRTLSRKLKVYGEQAENPDLGYQSAWGPTEVAG